MPSCEQCNKGAELDDEYFRLITILREDTHEHPDWESIWPVVYRAISSPQQVSLKHALVEKIEYVDWVTSSGIFIKRRPTIEASYARLNNVAQRITLGLFYHEKTYRLPDTYEASAWGDPFAVSDSDDPNRNARIASFLLSKPPRVFGNSTFSYRFFSHEEDPNTTAWLMIFYGHVIFLCITFPRE